MLATYNEVLLLTLIPALAMLLGGIISLSHLPSQKIISSVQHFAGGIVFAAVAIELLPLLTSQGSRITITLGFLVGVLTMLLIKVLTNRMQTENTISKLPLSLLIAVSVDLLIDGILIGVAFLTKPQSGLFIALALTFEIFFLGLSTIATLSQKLVALHVKILASILLSFLIPLGAVLGYGIFSWIPAYWLTEVIAFGVAALLYLVVEELLVEAHEIEDTPWITGMFFLGFLMILLLDIKPSM